MGELKIEGNEVQLSVINYAVRYFFYNLENSTEIKNVHTHISVHKTNSKATLTKTKEKFYKYNKWYDKKYIK